jgi:hypothetical protein
MVGKCLEEILVYGDREVYLWSWRRESGGCDLFNSVAMVSG